MASTSKTVPDISTKSLTLLVFLLLLFFVPLFARPLDVSMASMASSISVQRVLLHSPTTMQSTMNSNPGQPKTTETTTITTAATATAITATSNSNQQFWAAAHEVPSGPNPESNKTLTNTLTDGNFNSQFSVM